MISIMVITSESLNSNKSFLTTLWIYMDHQLLNFSFIRMKAEEEIYLKSKNKHCINELHLL